VEVGDVEVRPSTGPCTFGGRAHVFERCSKILLSVDDVNSCPIPGPST